MEEEINVGKKLQNESTFSTGNYNFQTNPSMIAFVFKFSLNREIKGDI